MKQLVVSIATFDKLSNNRFADITVGKQCEYKEGETIAIVCSWNCCKAVITEIWEDEDIYHLSVEKVWDIIL